MSQNSNLHNLRAVLIGPTTRFLFCEGATSAANAQALGYEDFGNIKAHQLQAENQTEPVITSLDGINRTVDEQSRMVTAGYLLTLREQSPLGLKFGYFGAEGTPFTQAAIAAQNGNALAFDVTAAVLNRWYQLQYSGTPVRNITTVTIAGKTEGTDFVLHKQLGLIRFLTAQTASLTPVITAPEVTAASNEYMKRIDPFSTPTRRGFARIICHDRDPLNSVIFDHMDFNCTLAIANQPDRNSEAGAGELQLKCMIMDVAGHVLARV